MDEAVAVGVVQGVGHRGRETGGFDKARPRLPEPFGEVGSLDEAGDDEAVAVVGAAGVKDGDDVGVSQRGQRRGPPEDTRRRPAVALPGWPAAP